MPLNNSKKLAEFDSVLKNNNEWFYDKPEHVKIVESTLGYAISYLKIVPKWIMLNDTAKEMRNLITDLEQKILALEHEVNQRDNTIKDLKGQVNSYEDAQ
jgi:hypothetical protein